VFLEGEGFEEGERDRMVWRELKDEEISPSLKNLSKWLKLMRKKHENH
jgi:hypothetical protein